MPLNDHYQRLALDAIEVPRSDRQRRDLKIDELFKRSIRLQGVINPIIVQIEPNGTKFRLVAGERRLQASRELGLQDIPVRFAQDLSPQERKLIELEENIKRLDLEWQDLVRGVAEIHSLYCSLDHNWTMGETAEACALTTSTVSIYLMVASALDDQRVAESGTAREAYNLLQRRQQRASGDALQALLEDEPPPEPTPTRSGEPAGGILSINEPRPPLAPVPDPILCQSFLEWAPAYSGKRFNLIHCDFPYGVNLFSSNGLRSGPQRSQMGRDEGESYEDRPEIFQLLLACLCDNLDKIMSISGHLMFWLSAKPSIVAETITYFNQHAPSLEFSQFPLVWTKSDNAGIACAPNYSPRHVYEICLLARRGQRQIVRLVSDHYSAPTDKSLHPSCKPEPMLRHFMNMLVDDNTSLLDPTAGSGTALRAAESIGATRILGLECNAEMAALANRATIQARNLRRASRTQS